MRRGVFAVVLFGILVGGPAEPIRAQGFNLFDLFVPQDRRGSRPVVNEPSMSRETRMQIQAGLTAAGFYYGPIDGVFGQGTRAAIVRWQEANGIRPTGLLTRGEIGRLREQAQAFGGSPGGEGGFPDGDGTAGMAFDDPVNGADLPLGRSETAELQQRLNELGYDAGAVDGRWGNRSRQALARFRQDTGQPGPADATVEALVAVRAASGEGPGGSAPSELPPAADYALVDSDSQPIDDAGRQRLRTLALQAIAADPALVDEDEEVLTFLRADDRQFGTKQVDAYGRANEFDRPRILSAARAKILAEAQETPRTPVKVAVTFRSKLLGYEPGRGFPLDVVAASFDPPDPEVVVTLDHLGGRIAVTVTSELPDLSVVPLKETEAEAFLPKVKRRDDLIGVAWASLSAEAVTDEAAPGRMRLVATVTAASLHNRGPRVGTGPWLVLADDIYRWRFGSDRPAPIGAGVVQLARELGIPLVRDHLLTPSPDGGDGAFLQRLRIDGRAVSLGWRKLVDYMVLGENPALADPDANVLTLAANHGKRRASDRNSFFGPEPLQFEDEFERKAFLDRARQGLIPALLAKTVEYPVPAAMITVVGLGEYDFERQGFALNSNRSDLYPSIGSSVVTTYVSGTLPRPAFLPMGVEEGKRFRRGLRGNNPTLYILTRFRITETSFAQANSRDPNGMVLTLRFTDSTIFSDAALTNEIHRYGEPDLTPKTQAPEITDAQALLDSLRLVSSRDLLDWAIRNGGGEQLADKVAAQAQAVQQANEFDAAAALEKERAEILRYKAADELWTTGEAQLGKYDGSGFPITESTQTYQTDPYAGHLNRSVNFQISNPNAIRRIEVERQKAEAGRRTMGNGRFQIAHRIRPVGVTPSEDKIVVMVEVLETIVWYRPEQNAPPVILARTTHDAPSAAADPATAPVDPIDRLALTQEGIDLLRVKLDPQQVTEADWHRMLVDRWVAERTGTATGARFFAESVVVPPTRFERDKLMPDFKTWTIKRAEAVGDAVELLTLPEGTSIACSNLPKAVYGLIRPHIRPAGIANELPNPPLEERTIYEPAVNKISSPALSPPAYYVLNSQFASNGYCLREYSNDLNRLYTEMIGSEQPKGIVAVRVDAVGLIPLGTSEEWYGTARRIEGRVTRLRVLPGTDGAMDVIVDVATDRTDYLPYDRNAERNQTALGEEAFATVDHAALVAAAEADAAAKAEAERNAVPFDIIGLSLGMDMAEAEKVIRDHMTVSRVFEKRRPFAANPADMQAYGSAKAFIREDGLEAIVIFNEPGAAPDEVVAISRSLYLDPKSVDDNAVMANLREKYGKEARVLTNAGMPGLESYWLRKPSDPPDNAIVACLQQGRQHDVFNVQGLWFENGVGQPNPWLSNADGTGTVFNQRPPYQQAPPPLPMIPEITAPTRPTLDVCGPTVFAVYRPGALAYLGTMLVDPARYADLLLESRKLLESASDPAAGSAPAEPKVKLKL